MIRFKTGDVLAEDAEVLVNTVNCVGVMGRGVALQFKRAFPGNFRAYAEACKRGDVRPGRVFAFETSTLANPRYIVNFPTKRHWRGKSRLEDIESGLEDLRRFIRANRIRSIALPPLGSGLGGWIGGMSVHGSSERLANLTTSTRSCSSQAAPTTSGRREPPRHRK